jgi:hypothetical protein
MIVNEYIQKDMFSFGRSLNYGCDQAIGDFGIHFRSLYSNNWILAFSTHTTTRRRVSFNMQLPDGYWDF